MTDQQVNLPDFETDSEPAPQPPKRQRKVVKRVEKAAVPKKPRGRPPGPAKAVPIPKRARKKRMPRRVPGRVSTAFHPPVAPPIVGPEAAGVIRSYMTLDEAQRAVVLAYIQALR